MKLMVSSLAILMLFSGTNASAGLADSYDMAFCGALNFQSSPTYSKQCDNMDSYDSALEEMKARGWDRALRSLWKKAKRQDRKASLSGDQAQEEKKEHSASKAALSKFFKESRYGLRASSHRLIMSVKMKF